VADEKLSADDLKRLKALLGKRARKGRS